jgi:hypothetical protein
VGAPSGQIKWHKIEPEAEAAKIRKSGKPGVSADWLHSNMQLIMAGL